VRLQKSKQNKLRKETITRLVEEVARKLLIKKKKKKLKENLGSIIFVGERVLMRGGEMDFGRIQFTKQEDRLSFSCEGLMKFLNSFLFIYIFVLFLVFPFFFLLLLLLLFFFFFFFFF